MKLAKQQFYPLTYPSWKIKLKGTLKMQRCLGNLAPLSAQPSTAFSDCSFDSLPSWGSTYRLSQVKLKVNIITVFLSKFIICHMIMEIDKSLVHFLDNTPKLIPAWFEKIYILSVLFRSILQIAPHQMIL